MMLTFYLMIHIFLAVHLKLVPLILLMPVKLNVKEKVLVKMCQLVYQQNLQLMQQKQGRHHWKLMLLDQIIRNIRVILRIMKTEHLTVNILQRRKVRKLKFFLFLNNALKGQVPIPKIFKTSHAFWYKILSSSFFHLQKLWFSRLKGGRRSYVFVF